MGESLPRSQPCNPYSDFNPHTAAYTNMFQLVDSEKEPEPEQKIPHSTNKNALSPNSANANETSTRKRPKAWRMMKLLNIMVAVSFGF